MAITQPPCSAARTTTGTSPSDNQKGSALPGRATCSAGMVSAFMPVAYRKDRCDQRGENAPDARSNALRIRVGKVGRAKGGHGHERAPQRRGVEIGLGNSTARRRWKCVKVWRTSAPVSRQSAASGAPPPAPSQSDPGQPSIPPSRPRVGPRFEQQGAILAPRDPDHALTHRLFGLRGLAGQGRPERPQPAPAQACHHGQMPQAGLRGVQIVAPRSMTACA